MASKQRTHKKKLVLIVTSVILALIIIVISVVFLTLRSYINRMNLETANEASYLDTSLEDVDTISDNSKIEEEAETEENEQSVLDATDSEILSVEEQIRLNMEGSSKPIVYDKDVFNILLIGNDSRKSGGAGRSDAMILISLNREAKTITATSFLRDIYLQIPEKGINRLNAAYAFGGADLLMKTMEQNFKIQVDRFVSIDFFTFIDVVDAIGGIPLEVLEEELPEVNKQIRSYNILTDQEPEDGYLTKSGTQLLDGKQALAYSRNRHTGNSDFDRTLRQRKVIMQIFDQVKKLNLVELDELLNEVLPQITTNLSEGEILSLILNLPSFTGYELDEWSIPMENTYSALNIRGMAVLVVNFEKNRKELYKRLSLK